MMSIVNKVLGDEFSSIELVDHMGSDLTVVNSARVSFGKRKTEMSDGDKKLIAYLANNKHWSPFRHVQFQFHIKAPEIVGRQFYKHIIGSDYTFKDHAWNEISGRYVVYEDEFYIPVKFTKQSADNKQATNGEEVGDPVGTLDVYKEAIASAYVHYKELINSGVCKEQARGVLPVSFYTEWYWTASLQAVANFIILRDHTHAQWEIKQYAQAMKSLVNDIVPVSMSALLEVGM